MIETTLAIILGLIALYQLNRAEDLACQLDIKEADIAMLEDRVEDLRNELQDTREKAGLW